MRTKRFIVQLAVLMPVYNEGERLAATLSGLSAEALRCGHSVVVFLVDDGSVRPVSVDALPRSTALTTILARHPVNLGQGAALETARRLALLEPTDFDAFVTMDADGQHRPEDAMAVARAIEAGADIALGDRFAGGSVIPMQRRALLRCALWFERVATGLVLSDVHNGLRAFRRCALERLCIHQSRMAHATELTLGMARLVRVDRMKLVEVPVNVSYTGETLAKGQRASGALAILIDLAEAFLFGEAAR